MIIDTSALIAILRDEPEALAFATAIELANIRRISAANFVEAANRHRREPRSNRKPPIRRPHQRSPTCDRARHRS